MEKERGVSEIVGAILLVALVILAMMIIAVALLSQPPPQEIPQVNAIAGNNSNTVFIRHNGGDSLSPYETIVRIDGNPNPVPNDQILLRYENGTQASWTTQEWSVGTTLVIPDTQTPQSVTLVYNGGSSQALLLTATFTEAPPSFVPTLPPGSYYTIISSAGPEGSISPSGSIQVPIGGVKSFGIIAGPCYRISNVLVDGSSVGAVSSYTFNNVQADHTISASFALNNLAIVATAGPNGVIIPNGTVPVNCTGTKSFSIIPNTGYSIQDVVVDGSSVGPVSTYTFTNIVVNHTITASFTNTPPSCIPVVASFTTNQTTGPVPFSVQFSDTSSGHPNSWQWNFGDGSANSTLQNPIHTYTTAGTYSVTLTASNTTCGYSGGITMTNLITANPPSSSCGTISGHKWNDLDGNGDWDIGEHGLSGWTINLYQRTSGQNYIFASSTTTNAQGYYIFSNLDFQGANHYKVTETSQQGWGSTYPSSGYFQNIVLNPGSKCYQTELNFGNQQISPPSANFYASPQRGSAPLSVKFTDISTGSPTQWAWDFDSDGTIDSTAQNPTFVYSSPGTYTVKMTASNAGGSNTHTEPSYIIVSSPPTNSGSIIFNKAAGGYLVGGTYMQFKTATGNSYIDINYNRQYLSNNQVIRLVIKNNQNSGNADIYTDTIAQFYFDVDLYIDNQLKASGKVTSINIQKYDSYASTLSFHTPAQLAPTNLVVNGITIIPFFPFDASVVDINNIAVPANGHAQIYLSGVSSYVNCQGSYTINP